MSKAASQPDAADNGARGGPAGAPRRARIGKGLVAALTGIGVVYVASVQLRGGPTIGGVPLQEVPVAEVSGLERLFADELVVLVTWGLVLLAAFLVASLVRGILDDRWLRRFGTGGAEIGETADAEAGLEVKQSRVLAELIAQVAALERDAVADREAVAEIFVVIETLSEALDRTGPGSSGR